MSVQALGPERPIEAFDEGIVSWLAGTAEVDLHAIPVSPEVHGLTGELAAVVTEQRSENGSLELHSVQHSHHILSLEALSCFDRHRLAGVDIDDGQRAEPAAILELIGQ